FRENLEQDARLLLTRRLSPPLDEDLRTLEIPRESKGERRPSPERKILGTEDVRRERHGLPKARQGKSELRPHRLLLVPVDGQAKRRELRLSAERKQEFGSFSPQKGVRVVEKTSDLRRDLLVTGEPPHQRLRKIAAPFA